MPWEVVDGYFVTDFAQEALQPEQEGDFARVGNHDDRDVMDQVYRRFEWSHHRIGDFQDMLRYLERGRFY